MRPAQSLSRPICRPACASASACAPGPARVPAATADPGEPALSIVVPVLDEATALPGLLAQLRDFAARGCELVVVDGGSRDGSVAIARAAGVTVVEAASGRAAQMNAGVRVARGRTLLFLHADTRLPADADALVLAALADGRHEWGRFDVRIEGRPALLPVVAALMNRRSRLTGIATGDQAMFMRRSVFMALGGFPDQPLMEDVELSRRLRRRSAPACLRARVITSGRRWEARGPWRTVFLMWRLRLAYWLGVSPERLARAYR
ncbi:TIGR04283 family arsenosugar biosynthesis glycosyltransferase [Derxia lacustris]|uniref:TIGR04283 family arsenosugar biosynthesis glycosyltransferase n=1 Tax=Derxia lacustris TaxID=764842 RepID=UPI000A1716AB|nr:TIGR04283 family arsenosugar biosynthesis glycosyltransferase [Derxia lacustris]